MTAHPPVLAVQPGARPEIVCPEWCVDTYEHHFDELGNLDGFVIHHSKGGPVWHSRCTYPDGTVAPDEPPMIWINASSDGVTIEQAEMLVTALRSAIEEAR